MIADQILYLGYPRIIKESLWLDLDLDYPWYERVTTDDYGNQITPYYQISYSLKSAAMRYLGINIDKSVRGKIINVGITEEVIVYAAGDVQWIDDIKEKQIEKLKEEDLLKAAVFECEAVKSIAYTKYCGVHLDATKWKAKMDSDQKRLEDAITKLNNWVIEYDKSHKYCKLDLQGDLFTGFKDKPDCTINWSSQKQVIPLFKDLGIKVKTFDKKTKKEKESIEEAVLSPQKDEFPIIPLFLEYQGAVKVVSTYGQNWLNAIDPVSGRIHVELHSVGTDTGRLSSGGGQYKLNQQNLPNDAVTRGCFTAEKDNVWLSCDYSG